jgi:hypothetical protein
LFHQVVEKIDRKKKMAKCRDCNPRRAFVWERPLRKLITCVGAFLRDRRGVIESYRADVQVGGLLSRGEYHIWIDRYADRCRVSATEFAYEAKGWAPSNIIDKALTVRQWGGLAKCIEAAAFWDLPSYDGNVGMDGYWWILEGVKNNRYHYVRRWCDDLGILRRMSRLAGIDG